MDIYADDFNLGEVGDVWFFCDDWNASLSVTNDEKERKRKKKKKRKEKKKKRKKKEATVTSGGMWRLKLKFISVLIAFDLTITVFFNFILFY